MEESIKEIVLIEWRMLDKVNNIGGRACCQNNFGTFNIMRTSQFEAWDKATRSSYYLDITSADKENRNLLTERYAYMMEYTHPEEYKVIKPFLPLVSKQKEKIIDEIVDVQLEWAEEMSEDYPLMALQGRPIYSSEDTLNCVSTETFMRGELKTYSVRTLKSFLHHIENLKEVEKNLYLMVIENIVDKYGYSSIDEAEERMRRYKNCY